MNQTRYHELLSRLFEGELSDGEADELAGGLRGGEDLRQDLRRHLVLWETWSQGQAPERSAEAFVAAFKTRFRAENEGSAAFSQAVRERLLTGEDLPPVSRRARPRFTPWRAPFPSIAALLHGIRNSWFGSRRAAGIAACLGLVGLVGLFWMAVQWPAQAVTTIQGDAVCTACVLHESQEHRPAIRVTDAGKARVYYLERNGTVFRLQDRFCGGPTPVTAKGKATTARGRLRFEATSISLPAKPARPAPENERERVILVI